jgi:membrane carboxypeptidase/penicillin-binding protein
MTLRRALEQSKNLVTARLLDGGVADSAPESLDIVCRLAVEAQLYSQCERFYPFVLGAQPVRPVDLAAFYAAIANEGARPTPHVIESIEQDGRPVYSDKPTMTWIGSADRPSFYQLKTILQGVVARGTAARLSAQSPYIAGKTGTSDEWNDAWFVGFSNDVTIAVWVGYDNAKGKRTLGSGQTGSRAALPIFDQIMQTVWTLYAPKTELAGPSPEAAARLVALPIDVRSGTRLSERSRNGFMEYFKIDADGQILDSPQRLVSRGDRYGEQEQRGGGFPFFPFGNFGRDYDGTPPDAAQRRRDAIRSAPPFFLPFFGGGGDDRQEQESRAQRRPQRPVPQQGGRQRYAEPPEERPRRGNDFFFGRGGGF